MRLHLTLVVTVFAVTACSPAPEPAKPQAEAPAPVAAAAAPETPSTAPAPAEPAPPAPAAGGSTMLRFFDDVLESDQPKKPTFELQAPKLAMVEDSVWQVEQATAIAYAKDGSETKFEAGAGRFDENTKTAQLSGGVSVSLGTQKVELQDMTWTNETRSAISENPVVVTDGDTNLKAGRMEYHADTKALALTALSGTVSMKSAAAAQQDAPSAFDFVDIKKGGLGEFIDGQLQRINGGVEIALRTADPNAKPMGLLAQEIKFLWPDGGGKPVGIALAGGVSVDGPQGLITANRADLDFASNKLLFSGEVRGKSDSIDSFDADRIVYDTKSGDSEMANLHASGIRMGDSGADAKGGATGFSRMNIERAGNVVSSGGQVKKMSGGVAITLEPNDPKAKALKLNASDATFGWSGEGGQPTSIALRGNVRVDGPQGAIRSDRGDFDLAKKQMTFNGNVGGSLPQLERFDTDKLTYNIESGETLMSNLRAKGMSIASGEKPEKPEDAAKSYSTMDIESAPEVSLTGQKLNWMRGGVSLSMKAADPAQPPLTVKAEQLTFAYAKEQDANPERVLLKGNVEMNSPQAYIKSDQADLSLATSVLVFTGNVTGSTPNAKDFAWTQFTYNMKTGQMSGKGFKAKRLEPGSQDADKKQQAPETKP